MIHRYIKNDHSGEHWAVGTNSLKKVVLAQVQDDSEQARIALTPKQAREFAAELLRQADSMDQAYVI